ncbi:IclR family transcriptional regulator domain-containing protein [Amycolatopsis pigmentata]|uniref:IclR family transcriptional regulator C-terminal domain-containing protein n=1 Tax=Amycolatopsis pigmentata TaxID=450801 RepID=A0ABW5FZM5_9PSEU
MAETETELVTSVERGLAVLAAFHPDRPAMTLSEVAKASDLDRASARRFLHTLLARGYLRADGQLFRLHPAVLELGNAYLAASRLPRIALPYLSDFVGRLNESASMAVLQGDQAVCVAYVPSRRLMTAHLTVGSRFPAHRTALGRVLLAGKPDEWLEGYLAAGRSGGHPDPAALRAEIASVRRDGWFTADEENLEAGIRALAVPVRDSAGVTIAAIGISSHADRLSQATLAEAARPALTETAHRIERAYLAAVPLSAVQRR